MTVCWFFCTFTFRAWLQWLHHSESLKTVVMPLSIWSYSGQNGTDILQYQTLACLLLCWHVVACCCLQSAAIAAVYSAGDALQTIRRHQEEQIIEHYMAQATAKITQQFDSL